MGNTTPWDRLACPFGDLGRGIPQGKDRARRAAHTARPPRIPDRRKARAGIRRRGDMRPLAMWMLLFAKGPVGAGSVGESPFHPPQRRPVLNEGAAHLKPGLSDKRL